MATFRSFTCRTTWVAGALALATAVMLGAQADGAFAGSSREPARGGFLPVPRTDWAKLGRTVTNGRATNVVVQLDGYTVAEHQLSRGARHEQRSEVAAARRALARELGRTGRAGSIRPIRGTSLVSLRVDSRDLDALRRSGVVAAVALDKLVSVRIPRPGRGARGVQPGGPRSADAVRRAGIAATSSNGSGSQLPYWWHWYRLGIDRTRAAGWTGRGQAVAIIDTGVDTTHPWLSRRVVNQACFAGSGVGVLGACPNGTAIQYGAGAAEPCTFSPVCGHGTHVAHIAAGQYGVAPGAGIVAIQIFQPGPNGSATYRESDLLRGLAHVYAIRGSYRIAAVNMSLGGGLFVGTCDKTGDGTVTAGWLAGWVKALRDVGIPTVVATGNNDSAIGLTRPACFSRAVAVGNSTITPSGADAVYGNTPGGSNSNRLVDVLAPGTDICSAYPYQLDGADGNKDGIVCWMVGTSMAAPQVTGAMALLRQKRPTATVDSMLGALVGSGPAVRDSRNGVTRTRIHLLNALSRLR